MAFTLVAATKNATLSTLTTPTLAYAGSGPSAHSLLICVVAMGNGAETSARTVSSITDTKGNTWALAGTAKATCTSAEWCDVEIWYTGNNAASGADTVTINTNHAPAGSDDMRIVVLEFTQTGGAGATLNKSGNALKTGGGNVATLTASTSAAALSGDLVVAASATPLISITESSSYVDDDNTSTGATADLACHLLSGTAAIQSCVFNYASSYNHLTAAIATFTETSGGTPISSSDSAAWSENQIVTKQDEPAWSWRVPRGPGHKAPSSWAQPIETDGVAAAADVPVSDSDSFAWTDANPTIRVSDSDVFAWTENQTIAATLSSADSEAWSEGTPTIRVSDSDTAAWSESQAVSVSRSDSDSFAWTDANPTIRVTDSDSEAWSEGTPTVRVTDSDSFTWSEGTATVRVIDSESATWSEGAPSIRVSDGDTAAWTESQSSGSTLSSSESATWSENQTVSLRDSDSAVWAEGTPQIRTQDTEAAAWADGNPSIRTSDTESAAWTETNPTIRTSGSDSALFTDAGESTRLTDSDTALWTEGQIVNVQADLYMDWRVPRAPGHRSPAAWAMPISRADPTTVVNPFPTDAETFLWTETQSLAPTLTDADSATWSEGTPTIRVSDSESATWSEGVPSLRTSDSDLASWSEGSPVFRMSGSETVAWAENNQVSARPIDSDSILWGDSESLRALFTDSEAWHYTDGQSVATADPRVRGTFIRPDGSPIDGVAVIKIAQEQPGIGVVIIGRFQVAFSGILDVPLPATRLGNYYEVAIYPEGLAAIRFDVPVVDAVLL